jgi:hypothetical protein
LIRSPTHISGSAGVTLNGGGGGYSNDDFSLTSKGKSGDYDAGNGSKTSVELGWHSGSNSNSSRFLGLGGTFSTNAAGGLDTNLTQEPIKGS